VGGWNIVEVEPAPAVVAIACQSNHRLLSSRTGLSRGSTLPGFQGSSWSCARWGINTSPGNKHKPFFSS